MNARSIPCLIALACWTAPLTADVLDDAKLSLKEFLALPGAFGASGADLAGIPLSPEHEAQLLALPAEPREQLGFSVLMLPGVLEARGHFQAALDSCLRTRSCRGSACSCAWGGRRRRRRF